jgi:hypothetical protein
MSIIVINDEKMAEIVESSFINFHAKGLDYICLQRSDFFTEKIYFFDNKISQAPEVVHPHNHRYDFLSIVMAGVVQNKIYHLAPADAFGATIYQKFLWYTPLNGGSGFEYQTPAGLVLDEQPIYADGSAWRSKAKDIHTLQIHKEGTIMRLVQCQDEYCVDIPTSTYCLDKEPPSLTGLYEKPTADQVIKRLRSLGMEVQLA